jgi:hypothetical protein
MLVVMAVLVLFHQLVVNKLLMPLEVGVVLVELLELVDCLVLEMELLGIVQQQIQIML